MIERHRLVVTHSDLVDPDNGGAVLVPEVVPGLRPCVPSCICGWRGGPSRLDAVIRAQFTRHLTASTTDS